VQRNARGEIVRLLERALIGATLLLVLLLVGVQLARAAEIDPLAGVTFSGNADD
jgi:hypothetical protein